MLFAPVTPGQVPASAAPELLRQQERERALREQWESTPDVRLPTPIPPAADRLPQEERPCFTIREIQLTGEEVNRFLWARQAADPAADPATGRCLGTAGINIVMKRIQNAIVARGCVTTRVLASPQDLNSGVLTLTVIPGRVRAIRFAADTSSRATAWNAVPIRRGELLDLRAIEQALENFKRVPSVETDIQIVPAEGADARPGESDLVIAWQQRSPPLRLNVALDDAGSRFTGKYQASATLSLDHALTLNDLFYLNVNRDVLNPGGKGTRGHTLHYSVPFDYWQLGVTASDYKYHQTVAGSSQNYVYSGASKNAEIRVSRLFYRDATRKTGAYLRGWTRRSNNFIDDTEIEVQRRRTGGWELGLTHREYFGASPLDASLAWRRGTGAFRAMAAPEEDFGEGTSRLKMLTADAQLALPFKLASQSLRYTAHWRAQWSRTPLVPQERFAIGGRYTVRGFDGELTLTGERGWLWRNDLGWTLGQTGQELYLGVDYGAVGGPSSAWLMGKHLSGAVIGWRGGLSGGYWDVFVGTPLHKPKGFQAAPTIAGFYLSWSC
ncbi:MAG: ShlB/FhaC/HecB family hemolysin secretion/activation protein [Candidatus Accumulibacter sp.]|nr:ShlB/FhaC/HecB family hemolysin secretion/activation protein [Accumulibacter sp.]